MRSGAYEVKVADKGEYALAQHIADGRLNASNVKQNLKDRSLNLTVVPARRLTNSSRPSAVLSPENLFPANVQEHRAEAMARNYDLNGGTHSSFGLVLPFSKKRIVGNPVMSNRASSDLCLSASAWAMITLHIQTLLRMMPLRRIEDTGPSVLFER